MSTGPEDIINLALDEIGYPKHIADIYEGSPAARIGLEIYGQTRDELQRDKEWSFQRKVGSLALLKGPPPAGGYSASTPWSSIYPYPGFLYEYSYPTDCLDLRAIFAPPLGSMPDLDPLPALYRVDNDATPVVSGSPPTAAGPPAKVIYCNVTNAMAVYRARIANPSLWQTGYIAALVSALTKKLATGLGRSNAQEQQLQETKSVATTELQSGVRG